MTHHCFLLARLASERAGLLEACLGLDRETLSQVPMAGSVAGIAEQIRPAECRLSWWSVQGAFRGKVGSQRGPAGSCPVCGIGDGTIQEILTHIAAWESWQQRSIRPVTTGQAPDLPAGPDLAYSAAFLAERADQTLDQVIAELQETRRDWLTWLLSRTSSSPQMQHRPASGAQQGSALASEFWQHDAAHARQIAAWREAQGIQNTTGPKSCLLAALDAARDELLAAVALVPEEERASRPICGHWTLRDLVGHQADWEQVGVEGMRHMVAGHGPQIEYIPDIDAWNEAHFQAHRDHSWDQVWDYFCLTRQTLRSLAAGMSEADLAHSYSMPWVQDGSPYSWLSIFVRHDREHAHDLRSVYPAPDLQAAV